MSIWELCEGMNQIKSLSAEPWRVVEAQHVLSSRDLVDSISEHELLEDMLEASKPPIPKEKSYLIFTPFRYPPLRYGSRFGTVVEPSLWYGSLELETAFTEVAYYRLKFFAESSADLGSVEISMTAFKTFLKCERGVDLTQLPFAKYTADISNKYNHEHSQQLGAQMRASDVEAFVYCSARTSKESQNIAAYQPSVFQSKNRNYINNQHNWHCYTNKKIVEFTRVDYNGKKQFSFTESFFN